MPSVLLIEDDDESRRSTAELFSREKWTVFEAGEKIRLVDIPDGTSNTIMIVEAADPVPWTKPEDIVFDPDKPLPKLGGEFPDIINAAFCDGSVHTIDKKKIDDKLLRLLIMRNTGQPKSPPQ